MEKLVKGKNGQWELIKIKPITPEQQKANRLKNIAENNKRAFAESGVKESTQSPSSTASPDWHYMSTDPRHHAIRAAGHSLYNRPVISDHHLALKEHFSGEKPLAPLEVKRHQAALKKHYDTIGTASEGN